jgi:predicted nucleotidyltransferase
MLTQSAVDHWLDQFLANLRDTFGSRLTLVAHHGSWAKGEARPDSDIDAFVLLDRIDQADLETYRILIHTATRDGTPVSTFLGSVAEVKAWPRHDLVHFWFDRKILHGRLEGLVEKPEEKDFIEDIRVKAAMNLHSARHYLLHPHDLAAVIKRPPYPFKECCYALQSWLLLKTGKFIPTKNELLDALSDPLDKEIVRVTRDWHDITEDRLRRPQYYFQLLEQWCRSTLARIGEWKKD